MDGETGGSDRLFPEGRINRSEHRVMGIEDGAVLESQDADTQAGKVLRACGVVCLPGRVGVHGAVELDGQALGLAVEVEDIGADAVLPAELAPPELATLEVAPQHRLGGGAVRAEVLTRAFLRGAVADADRAERFSR